MKPFGGSLILVVDDDEDIRCALGDTLEAEGYRVVLAEDGRDALEKLRGLPELPAMILLDLMMPNMDGLQFRAAQQGDPALSSIPVIVLSADSQVKQKAATLGVAGCMAKPVRITDLLKVVERFARAQPSPSL
jgi:two-component system, chemotaxis family, chemotaxis protein CheY